MRPVCLLLPAQSDLANGIWTLFELGLEARACWQCPDSSLVSGSGALGKVQRSMDSPDHLHILVCLVRDHLRGENPLRGGIWLERRELRDLLHLLEFGLGRLEWMSRHSPSGAGELNACVLESVADLLDQVRARLGMIRKPAQRQAELRVNAAAAG
jgi:hypothetical protein